MQSESGLGRAIQVRRAELGLKRKDLARLASLSYPYLSELENGSKAPSARALGQLADALQLSRPELLSLADAMEALAPASQDARPSATDTSAPGSERWMRHSVVVDTSRGAAGTLVGSAADSAILDRIAELVAITVRAELNAWARNELPALIREEFSRLAEQPERHGL